jgi:DNA-directed RNA polymerase subunit RPC12/RpoP
MPETDKARDDQSVCKVCWDEGYLEPPNLGQPIPCPACSPRRLIAAGRIDRRRKKAVMAAVINGWLAVDFYNENIKKGWQTAVDTTADLPIKVSLES